MKVALIGDIHANLPALEAVVADAHRRGVEAFWHVGDWLGYGAFPNEVVALLRQEPLLSIVGNYDLKVFEIVQEPEKKGRKAEKQMAFRWAYEHLTKENRKYLQGLSQQVRLEVAGRRILLTHGSPASNAEHLTAETSPERLRELAELANADVIICGHSHRPFARKVRGVWFINTGSVGRPDDGDPRACYATLSIGPGVFRVRHHRVEYDVERAVAAIRQNRLPEAFAQMILQGRSLEAIEEGPAGEAPPYLAAPAEVLPQAAPAAVLPEPAMPSEEEPLWQEQWQGVLRLAMSRPEEDGHSQQVTRLALRLFDTLQPLHGLGPQERFWLQCAGMLHDIGWVEGWKAHHKTSLRMILDSPLLAFDRRERLIVGSIARYHRRALPGMQHAHFAELRARDRQKVMLLAALLRVADGLDCTHQGLVEDLGVELLPDQVRIRCRVRAPAEGECLDALDKSDLLGQVLARKVTVEMEEAWR